MRVQLCRASLSAKSIRRAIPPWLLAFPVLLGFHPAFAAPPTTITPNGLGTSVMPPTGGIYNITGGTTAGNNLFHSFSTFNLGTGNTADFNVSANITNILARVTGGPSSIDGTITSTIGAGGPLSSANLFLINPAGVMFTANAQINLGGSFVVSTANYVKFSDGSYFYGDVNHPIQDAGLTSAPVSAFGFLTPTPQPVSFTGSQITMPAGTGIHVISGDIDLNGATLLAPAGNLTLFSAAAGGEAPFSLASPGSGYSSATIGQFGSISLTNGSQAEIDGAGGGSMVIRGGRIVVDNSYVTSGNYGNVAGGNISVQADQLTLSNGGFIGTDAFGGANGGSVDVNVAEALDISGAGSQISANTDSSGDGGVVAVTAGSIDLNDGNIFANVSNPGATGHGGTVIVNAGSMTMEGESSLSSITDGPGAAGTVDLTLTGPLTMTDNAAIAADTYTAANGGDIDVVAAQIDMTGQSLISANTFFSTGRGGQIDVQAGSLSIQGTGSQPADSLGITAQTLGPGDAGEINVTAGALSLGGGAVISGASFGGGNGGDVSVDCVRGTLSGQSLISASSLFTNAGSVDITANDSLTLSSGSSISTSAGDNGGDISLKVGQLLYLLDSDIQAYAGVASTHGQTIGGNGGNIFIDPEFVVLDGSFISANALSGGQNGDITNFAGYFFTSDSLLHATGTIETTPPDLDLAASLVFLPANLVSAENQLRERCAQAVNHEFSTFIVVGRGGIESAPQELQPDFGLSPRLPAPGAGQGMGR